MILCIDPSTAATNTGWAIFETWPQGTLTTSGILVACGKTAPPPAWLTDITEAVLERPVIYPHGRTPNPNDIVKLGVTVGEMAGVLAANGVSVRYVEPRAWKGTLDKDTCCRRAWGRLRPDDERWVAEKYRPETSGPVRGGKDHVLDAIGIGLWAIGRWRH